MILLLKAIAVAAVIDVIFCWFIYQHLKHTQPIEENPIIETDENSYL
jgi:hypothetical protein